MVCHLRGYVFQKYDWAKLNFNETRRPHVRATLKAMTFFHRCISWTDAAVWEQYTSFPLHAFIFLFIFFYHWLFSIKAFMLNHIWQGEPSRGLSKGDAHRRAHAHSHMKWRNPWIVQQLGSHDTLLTELSQALLKRLKVCAWAMVLRLHSPTDALSSNPLVFTKTQFARLFL